MNVSYRDNQKSIRISDEVLQFINDFEGSSFNDKINNMVLYLMKMSQDKQEEIERMDNQLEELHRKYVDLYKNYNKMHQLQDEYIRFISVFKNFNYRFQSIGGMEDGNQED